MTTDNDYEIRRAIEKRIDWSGVPVAQVAIGVTDHAVTLAGELATTHEKESVILAAHQVRGVRVVVDELVVREPDRVANDADVARVVQAALAHDDDLAPLGLSATVSGRVVTLTGVLDEPEQSDRARRAVRALPGVRGVVDQIRVRPTPDPLSVHAAVTAALERAAAAESGRLDVGISGHVVHLGGTVHSWYERRSAERAALAVDGVTRVDNRLVVVSG